MFVDWANWFSAYLENHPILTSLLTCFVGWSTVEIIYLQMIFNQRWLSKWLFWNLKSHFSKPSIIQDEILKSQDIFRRSTKLKNARAENFLLLKKAELRVKADTTFHCILTTTFRTSEAFICEILLNWKLFLEKIHPLRLVFAKKVLSPCTPSDLSSR